MDEKRAVRPRLSSEEVRRGPWTVDEDLTLINYIATHGEGRWNTLALSAGLKRTGKSCRLRWLNYLRPDVRLGNITLQEQLLILQLHSCWGNRWSKIAQYLPGRTDNEIKNYWRTRVQKHAKQLKCDVNSKQFKDTMRDFWMPRLVERIDQAAAAASATTIAAATTTHNAYPDYGNKLINANYKLELQNDDKNKMGLPYHSVINNDFVGSHVTQSYTPENSNAAASSSDSFGTQVSPISDYHSVPVSSNNNPTDYYQPSQISYSDCITSPSGLMLPQGLDFQSIMDPNTSWNMPTGDTSDNFWNVDSMLFVEQQLMNDNM